MEKQVQKSLWLASMILAPLLLTICQFFWKNGVLTGTAGWIQVLSFLFWIFAFQGMFELVKERFPKYAVWGFFLAVYGCLAGNNFGVEGIYNEALHLTDIETATGMRSKFGTGGLLAFFLPGILCPLSWLVLGIQLLRARKIDTWLAVLFMFAAVAFPVSRMPRIEWLAHLDNAMLLLSMVLMAWKFYGNRG